MHKAVLEKQSSVASYEKLKQLDAHEMYFRASLASYEKLKQLDAQEMYLRNRLQ